MMNALEVIDLIPDKLLDELALESEVDFSVKKLRGKIIFKLFLYAVLSGRNVSLRILEAIFKSERFRALFNLGKSTIKHSGIGMRLMNIDFHYFENIFQYLVDSKQVDEIIFSNKKINIRKIDSTIVVLSSKLLKFGMDNNVGQKNLKYSVEINQGIPVNIAFFKEQAYISEDKALPEIIKKRPIKTGLNIAVFDRGIHRKETFTELAKDKIYFISRLTNQKYTVIKDLPIEEKLTASLEIIADQIVKFSINGKLIDQEIRLVTGLNRETKERIAFVTDVDFLSAVEISELYKSRWEIETFFKFIKQELNFSHLLSRNENGIKVLMYLTMIAAILLTIYKKVNKVVGWAVTKIKFLDELETSILREWNPKIISNLNNSCELTANVRDV